MSGVKLSFQNIFLLFLLVGLIGYFAVGRDGKANIYYWNRIVHGSTIGDSKVQIEDDYFIHSRKEEIYIIFHRNYFDMPFSVILTGKVDHSDLERIRFISLVKQIDSCKIYNKVAEISTFYIDYHQYSGIGVVAESDVIDDERMSIMCSVLKADD